ncbi:hypothetical protein C8A00DRAFT_15644 [Chaetomidium leptoderma]|uniref:holo-[acyl-carrier-protein] synthase n=1 Tax=Chaetomidium leptoderma TaxID=669021 RepID=A0AAN6VMT3_9PEZI|nr:hypothetical protein C8A00DRAFT_15644 [Chaetomidium leptoderma]
MPPPETPETPDTPVIAQWIFDTRSWYPEVTQTKQLETHASRALALLTPSTRPQILRYYHARDAKMALASALIKHYAIAKLHPKNNNNNTPPPRWSQTTITRDARTKPVYIDPATGAQPVAFNVSHQAGIVALIAVVAEEEVEVGVDIVCTSERRARDQGMIVDGGGGGGGDGWAAFVDMHADVFAAGEVDYLKHKVLAAVPELVPATSPTAEQVADGKLRAFYALWALREAYVKLTGEALLAEWLGELEFRGFRPPRATAGWEVPADEEGGEEVIREVEIWFKGKRVEDVNMCLRSMGPDYMVATAVRTPGKKELGLGWTLGPYEVLSLEEVLDFAESSG